jgi:hypothetical protein
MFIIFNRFPRQNRFRVGNGAMGRFIVFFFVALVVVLTFNVADANTNVLGPIRIAADLNGCLDYNPGNGNIYVYSPCFEGENQKWDFDPETKTIRSSGAYSNICMKVSHSSLLAFYKHF